LRRSVTRRYIPREYRLSSESTRDHWNTRVSMILGCFADRSMLKTNEFKGLPVATPAACAPAPRTQATKMPCLLGTNHERCTAVEPKPPECASPQSKRRTAPCRRKPSSPYESKQRLCWLQLWPLRLIRCINRRVPRNPYCSKARIILSLTSIWLYNIALCVLFTN
jgi:hypothetical protein